MGGFRDGSVIRCKLDADIHINSIENSWSLHCGWVQRWVGVMWCKLVADIQMHSIENIWSLHCGQVQRWVDNPV